MSFAFVMNVNGSRSGLLIVTWIFSDILCGVFEDPTKYCAGEGFDQPCLVLLFLRTRLASFGTPV